MNTTKILNRQPLADEAARRWATKDSGKNSLLEAGAGTGKTSALVERLLDIIKTGAAPIEGIVAITFTNKAAAEMLERLRDRLEEYLCREEEISPQTLKVRQALGNFENHHITTIDKFARQILLETPFEAGVDPQFSIIEEIDENALIDQLWESWTEEETKNEESSIYTAYMTGLKGNFLKKLFKFIYTNRDYFENYEFSMEKPNLKKSEEKIGEIITSLMQLAGENCSDPKDAGFKQILNTNEKFKKMKNLDYLDKSVFLLEWGNVAGRTDAGIAKNWGEKENKQTKKKWIEDLNYILQKERQKISRYLLDSTVSRLTNFIKIVEDEKQSRGVLSFDDMLRKTRNLLRDNRKIREFYKRRFSRILIDEFQDTNPRQIEIAAYLAEKPDNFEKNWEKCSLVEGKLFFVGDPKQSIYRFRQADIEIYEKTKKIVEEKGEINQISVNFRTAPQIIEWINRQFSRLIKPPPDGDYQSSYIPLDKHREGNDLPQLTLLSPDENLQKKTTKKEEVIREEARAAADYIKKIVEEKKTFTSKKGESRPLSYGDIAILYPRSAHIDKYEEALQKQNIPFITEGGRYFYQRQEILDIISVLKAIDNPADEVALIASLKSALFSFSDQDLYEMKTNGIPFKYTFKDRIPHPASRAYEILNRLHERRNKISIAELIEEIVDETFLREFYITGFPNNRREANLDKFINKARQFDSEIRGTLWKFLRQIEGLDASQPEESDAPSTGNQDAVHLMTFHKAKGLEFPGVVLSLLSSQSMGDSPAFIFNKETNRLESQYKKLNQNYLLTADYEKVREMDKKREEAENIRLLYVAATRARDMIILPTFAKYDEKSEQPTFKSTFQEILQDTILNQDGEISPLFQTILYNGEYNISTTQNPVKTLSEEKFCSIQNFSKKIKDGKNTRTSIIEKSAKTQTKESYTSLKKSPKTAQGENQKEQVILGKVFHEIMEKIDFRKKSIDEKLIKRICEKEKIAHREKELAELVKKTLQANFIDRAVNSGNYYREFPFTLRTGKGNQEGIIDLLIVEKDGITIIDYKTDETTSENAGTAAERYRFQANIYKNALENITGQKIKEFIYYFCRPNTLIKVNFK